LLDLPGRSTTLHAGLKTGVHNWHTSTSPRISRAGVYFFQSKDPKFLNAVERNYQTLSADLSGQFQAAVLRRRELSAWRTRFSPGFEKSGIVEFMHSYKMLTKISATDLGGSW